MTRFRMLVTLAVLQVPAYVQMRSQTDFITQNQFNDAPKFSVAALCFASDDSTTTRLDVYVDVGYDVLHFVNEANLYRASYEITVSICDSLDHSEKEKTWVEILETADYAKSISPKESNLSQRSFAVAPGNYFVHTQITDQETKKRFALKRPVTVRSFHKAKFSLSDIMLVNSLTYEGEKKVISPNISGDVGNLKDGVILFFEAYNNLNIDSTKIVAKILNLQNDVIRVDTFTQALSGPKTSCFHTLATSNLSAGDYIVKLEAHPHKVNADSSTIDVVASASHTFLVRWKGLPVSVVDLDAAISQMIYIVEKDKLDEMKKADPDRKKQLFEAYWRKKDPTPGTDRNEMMDEYYGRVEFANKHFTHFTDGWKSDMGMVYIIFGVPSNIDRHPFDSDVKPYEVWTYYELNRQFVFVDQSGFGDYHLQNPIWDVWSTRPR